MRYRCSKSCGYLFKGSIENLPDKCPGCGAELKKYILSRTKGTKFEDYIVEQIKLFLGGHPKRDRFSGSRIGRKNDVYDLPYPIKNFGIEGKDDLSMKVMFWWEQAVREGEQMAKDPMLIFKYKKNALCQLYFLDLLKLVKKLCVEK